jgi:hypothetical protein
VISATWWDGLGDLYGTAAATDSALTDQQANVRKLRLQATRTALKAAASPSHPAVELANIGVSLTARAVFPESRRGCGMWEGDRTAGPRERRIRSSRVNQS